MSDNNTSRNKNVDRFHHETNSVDHHEDKSNAHHSRDEHHLNHDGEDQLPRKEKKIAMTYRLAPTMAAVLLAMLVLLTFSRSAIAADDSSGKGNSFTVDNCSQDFSGAFVSENDLFSDNTAPTLDTYSVNGNSERDQNVLGRYLVQANFSDPATRDFVTPTDNIDGSSFVDSTACNFANSATDNPSFIDNTDRYYGDANCDIDNPSFIDNTDRYFGDANCDVDNSFIDNTDRYTGDANCDFDSTYCSGNTDRYSVDSNCEFDNDALLDQDIRYLATSNNTIDSIGVIDFLTN